MRRQSRVVELLSEYDPFVDIYFGIREEHRDRLTIGNRYRVPPPLWRRFDDSAEVCVFHTTHPNHNREQRVVTLVGVFLVDAQPGAARSIHQERGVSLSDPPAAS